MTDSPSSALLGFTEHRVPRDRGNLYVRDYPGSGPAFVADVARILLASHSLVRIRSEYR